MTGVPRLRLVVTVDTEEDGLWRGDYPRERCRVDNLRGLDRFHGFCRKWDLRPTYLCDWPVVECAAAVKALSCWQKQDECEIGAHLHPWCNPPLKEEANTTNSYLCNLREELQYEKLAALTIEMEHRFGRRPTSFRAGRYGLDSKGFRILEQLGYRVDSSVTPFFDWSNDGGPDFRFAPWLPYFPLSNELTREGNSRETIEIPVTCGFTRGRFKRTNAIWQKLATRPWRSTRLIGALDRIKACQRIPLSPEKATSTQMNRLVDACVGQDTSALVMILHSSSLAIGFSPYVGSADELEAFYARMEATFRYCRSRYGAEGATLTEVADAVIDKIDGSGLDNSHQGV